MFVRFLVRQKLSRSKHASGLFVAAGHLQDNGDLRTDEHAYLEELLEWFRVNLPVPNRYQQDARAIYWFRPSAKQHIRRMWELAALLEQHNYQVELVTIDFAGLLTYQDDFQIGAIPQVDRHR